jgi:hypothetical protein
MFRRQTTVWIDAGSYSAQFAKNDDRAQPVLWKLLSDEALTPDACFASLDQAFPSGLDPRTSTQILSGLAKERALHAALLALWWHVRNTCELNGYHYNAVIDACARTGTWKKAQPRHPLVAARVDHQLQSHEAPLAWNTRRFLLQRSPAP